MADFIVFQETGTRKDGTPDLTGPIGPIIRGKGADDYEAALGETPGVVAGAAYVVFRWDHSATIEAEGSPSFNRVRG